MSLEVKGKLEKFLEKQSGKTKSGKEWEKQSFLIRTDEQYNNLYCFEVFGKEKVDNLNKFYKVGQMLNVTFNVQTNEYKGNYYVSLSAWMIKKDESPVDFEKVVEDLKDETPDDLPF